MKISNNKNTAIIDTDEVQTINVSKNGYNQAFDITFWFKGYSSTANWSFKTQEERDKVLAIIKKKIEVVEINDTDLVL